MRPRHLPAPRDAGMTLVEVMLVIFIMGLVTSVAVMTLPPRETQQERAVRKVETVLRDAQDRSVLTGEIIGIQPTENGIELVSWTGEEWLAIQRARLDLPDGVRLEVLPPDGALQSREDTPQRIIFNPLGRAEPINVAVNRRSWSQRLTLTPDGEVIHDREG